MGWRTRSLSLFSFLIDSLFQDLFDAFQRIPDPRRGQGQRHKLAGLLLGYTAAMLCNGHQPLCSIQLARRRTIIILHTSEPLVNRNLILDQSRRFERGSTRASVPQCGPANVDAEISGFGSASKITGKSRIRKNIARAGYGLYSHLERHSKTWKIECNRHE